MMIKDYKFTDIEKYLKSDKDIGKDILEAFERLFEVAVLFCPVVHGISIVPLLEILEVKNKVFDLGHKVYDYVTEKNQSDYIARAEQIKVAYALICYTAYFDTLEVYLPKEFIKKIVSQFKNNEILIKTTDNIENDQKISENKTNIHCNIFMADHITSFCDIKEQLSIEYKRVTNNLIKMIEDSIFFQESQENNSLEFEHIKQILGSLPDKAIVVYEAQYLKLADKFNDFALFAQLQNFEGINSAMKKNQDALNLLASTTQKIDIGLNNLNDIVNSMSANYGAIQSQDIVDDLQKQYASIIQEPIINDKEIKPDSEIISLKYPKIVDAFIPQSYKCLSYKQKEIKLENASVWDQLPLQEDLDKFFIKYLCSPESIDWPLIILGQPGSGKSLLTKVLSAQLMSNTYTVIRIPLREVNAQDGIDILVEDQIRKLTNRSLTSTGYGGFASQFKEKPLLIILDGYDELLQAKGDVYSGYLERVRKFQQDQKLLNRPVRIIITSRITLIDKARIPLDSTVLRLMEFSPEQQKKWIDIWNDINNEYFNQKQIKPFCLPIKGKKSNIGELAEQPLLLLMLALYDSEANELAKVNEIKKTELYDNLLRRFVRRERRRYVVGFEDKSFEEQEKIIDQEMNRLGVVAIGMYNRQGVVIKSEQLEKDLDIFNAHRNDGSAQYLSLKESESVLGGFFFIHRSMAKDEDAHSENSDSAYEFLHNTFGEFLAADFILRNTINEVSDIYVDRAFKKAGLENKLSNPDALNKGWFYCLMFVPLYSRPVVIEMLREHAAKAMQRALSINNSSINLTKEVFIENLVFLIKNQLKMVLNTRNTPEVMRNGILFDRDISLLGYLSIYSLNLIILATTLCETGFSFDEEEYKPLDSKELNIKPWDRLASMWKAWFLPADLMGLSAILKAHRKSKTVIFIEYNHRFKTTQYEQPIDILLCISSTLADDLLVALTGLHSQRFAEITHMDVNEICRLLKMQNENIYVQYLISLLRKELNKLALKKEQLYVLEDNYLDINRLIVKIIDEVNIYHINWDTQLVLFEIFESCLVYNVLFASTCRKLFGKLSELVVDPDAMLTWRDNFLRDSINIKIYNLLIKCKKSWMLDGDKLIIRTPFLKRQYFTSREYDYLSNKYMGEYVLDGSSMNIGYREEYQGYNMHHTSLQNLVHNSVIIRKDYIKRILRKYFVEENLDILICTNLELASEVAIIWMKSFGMHSKETNKILDLFLKKSIKQFYNIGIEYFSLNAIINVVIVARNLDESYLNDIRKILYKKILGRHIGVFWALVSLYPDFICKLYDVLPEIFYDLFGKVQSLKYHSKSVQYIIPKKIFKYIKVFRIICEACRIENFDLKIESVDLHMFSQNIQNVLHESRYIEEMDLDRITVEQLDDLIWYVQIVGDKVVLKKIEKRMSQYPNFDNYLSDIMDFLSFNIRK